MSSTTFSLDSNDSSIDRILEQGEKLRNAIVASILQDDPLNTDIIDSCSTKNKITTRLRKKIPSQCDISPGMINVDKEKLRAFLAGDSMSRRDEIEALETFKSMSSDDLCRTTKEFYNTKHSIYSCRTNQDDEVIDTPKEPIKQNLQYLKNVDSIRIIIHELILNERGKHRIASSPESKKKSIYTTQTFFVEYKLPTSFIISEKKNTNSVRISARNLSSKSTKYLSCCFKHTSTYSIKNISELNLSTTEIKFRIYCRCLGQKTTTSLGGATFKCSNFFWSPRLTCSEELPVNIDDKVALPLGKLKITILLGCDKLYFGREFIDSLKPKEETDITTPTPELNEDKENQNEVNKQRDKATDEIQQQVLIGFLFIPEAEYSIPQNSFIQCKLFCQPDTSYSQLIQRTRNPIFNFSQFIPLVYEDELLQQFRDNFLVVEFRDNNDVIGIIKLSLHQFYIAYRNPDVTKYLCFNKLPVITCDAWQPIINPFTHNLVGQAEILLALGTQEQIDNLKQDRGFKDHKVTAKKVELKNAKKTEEKASQSDMESNKEETSNKLSEILNQIRCMQTQRSVLMEVGTNTENVEPDATLDDQSLTDCDPKTTPPIVRSTSDLLNTLQAALAIPENLRESKSSPSPIRTSFKTQICIIQALHLPVRKKCKSKKNKSKNDDNVKPSTYVTFETLPGLDVTMTPLVVKSCSPNWNYKCDVLLPTELLLNNQKRLTLKVWRKSTNASTVPNLQSDLILGFATIDLTVLLAGFPNIQGWYNITDFSGKCNGQINVYVIPLEDLSTLKPQKETVSYSVSPSVTDDKPELPADDKEERDTELLSRALKRKFTELDEITQRLRLRLSRVTNEDDVNDEIADEFERDINSISIEDDFDMLNFEDQQSQSHSQLSDLLATTVEVPNPEDVRKEFENTAESLDVLDRQLLQGKQRIDTLLGKLSLISSDANFSSRYVSGCSVIDTEAILKDLDKHSRPNIHAATNFDRSLFDRVYQHNEEAGTSSSGTSVISDLVDFRAAPDGQGTFCEDKTKAKN